LADKIRIAVIYRKEMKFLYPTFRDNTLYYFFKHALNRNKRLDTEFFVAEDKFDTRILKNNFDVILLPDNRFPHIPYELSHIAETNIPVISRTGDPHHIKKYNKLQIHESHKIKYYFGPLTEDYFHKFFPKEIKFKFIMAGLEPDLYNSVKPFSDRISDKILSTGNIGNIKIKSRIANAILSPKMSSWYFYKLRTLCNQLSYVDYSGMSQDSYIQKDYPLYVSGYQSAIAASTYYAVIKYLELTAAGCLTFMEVSEKNYDAEVLGFKDYKNAIFINEKNYKEKFNEFLSSRDNHEWEKIANAGRIHTLKNLNNDKMVESLIELIEEVI
jgi:hypothetical protein